MKYRTVVAGVLATGALLTGCSNTLLQSNNPGFDTDNKSDNIISDTQHSSDQVSSSPPVSEPVEDTMDKNREEDVQPLMEEYSKYRLANDTHVIEQLFNDLIDSSKSQGSCNYSWEEDSNITICFSLSEMLNASFITLYPLDDIRIFLLDADGDTFKYFCELPFRGQVLLPDQDLDYEFEELVALDVTVTKDSVVTYGATYQVDSEYLPDGGDPDEDAVEEDDWDGDIISDEAIGE